MDDNELLLKALGLPSGLPPDELRAALQKLFNVTNGDPVVLGDVVAGSTLIGSALPRDDDEPWSSSYARRFCRKSGWVLKINDEWVTLTNSAEAFSENLPTKTERDYAARQPLRAAARKERLKEGTLFSVVNAKKTPR
jgi:hypothetical protein